MISLSQLSVGTSEAQEMSICPLDMPILSDLNQGVAMCMSKIKVRRLLGEVVVHDCY